MLFWIKIWRCRSHTPCTIHGRDGVAKKKASLWFGYIHVHICRHEHVCMYVCMYVSMVVGLMVRSHISHSQSWRRKCVCFPTSSATQATFFFTKEHAQNNSNVWTNFLSPSLCVFLLMLKTLIAGLILKLWQTLIFTHRNGSNFREICAYRISDYNNRGSIVIHISTDQQQQQHSLFFFYYYYYYYY